MINMNDNMYFFSLFAVKALVRVHGLAREARRLLAAPALACGELTLAVDALGGVRQLRRGVVPRGRQMSGPAGGLGRREEVGGLRRNAAVTRDAARHEPNDRDGGDQQQKEGNVKDLDGRCRRRF